MKNIVIVLALCLITLSGCTTTTKPTTTTTTTKPTTTATTTKPTTTATTTKPTTTATTTKPTTTATTTKAPTPTTVPTLNTVNVTELSITLNFPFGKRSGIYTGEMVNDLPHGKGTFASFNEYQVGWIYSGNWANGVFHGDGTSTWKDDGKITQTQSGNYTNGKWNPTKLQHLEYLIQFYGQNILLKNQNTITITPSIFFASDYGETSGKIDINIKFEDIINNQGYNGKLMMVKKPTVTYVEIVNDPQSGKKWTSIAVVDENDKPYVILCLDVNLNINNNDSFYAIYGLAIYNYTFEEMDIVILAGSWIAY